MNYKKCFLLSLSAAVVLLAGCSKNNNENNQQPAETPNETVQNENLEQKNEETNEQQIQEQDNNKVEESKIDVSKISIKVSDKSIWSNEEAEQSVTFARNIMKDLVGKDMKSLSEKVSYPINLNVSGKSKKITSKKDFAALKFSDVFSDAFVKNIVHDVDIFCNYEGFMISGDDTAKNIWFSIIGNSKEMKITAINN